VLGVQHDTGLHLVVKISGTKNQRDHGWGGKELTEVGGLKKPGGQGIGRESSMLQKNNEMGESMSEEEYVKKVEQPEEMLSNNKNW